MRGIRWFALALTLAAGAGACSSGLQDAVDDWADDACGCKDRACAEKMKHEFDQLETKYRKEIKDLSESEARKVDRPYRKGAQCLEKYDVYAG